MTDPIVSIRETKATPPPRRRNWKGLREALLAMKVGEKREVKLLEGVSIGETQMILLHFASRKGRNIRTWRTKKGTLVMERLREKGEGEGEK